MIPNLIDRFIGRMAKARTKSSITLSSLTTTAYAAGDVLNTGAVTKVVQCAALSGHEAVDLVQVQVHEVYASGSAIKPGMKIHLFDKAYACPAQNAPFVGPSEYLTHLGTITIATGDYVEHNGYALAVVPVSLRLRPAENTRNLHAVAVTTGTPTFAADAGITVTFEFDA